MSRKLLLIVSLLLMLAGSFGIGYYTRGHRSSPTQPSFQPTPIAPSPSPESTPSTYPIAVFFSKHPDSDNDPSKTFPVGRISPDNGVARYALSELLRGPSDSEKTQGYFSTTRLRADASSCGGDDFKLSIVNGTATLQFCRSFDHLGVIADGQSKSAIEATLKQFSTIHKVIILNNQGDCEFDLSGQNLCKQ